MKKIDTLVLKSFIGPFFVTFFISMFVFIMQFFYKYIEDFIGKGLEWYVIVEVIAFFSVRIVPEVLPLAILLASLMTFGNLGERYELVALKSSGISLQRFFRSLFVVSVGFIFISFWFSNNALPKANLKFQTLLYSVYQKKPAFNIQAGVFYNGLDNYIIKVKDKSEDGRILHNIIIYDHAKKNGQVNIVTAERGEIFSDNESRNMMFRLFNGHRYEEANEKGNSSRDYLRTSFDSYDFTLDLGELDFQKTDEKLFQTSRKVKSVGQLLTGLDSLALKRVAYGVKTLKSSSTYVSSLNDSTLLEQPIEFENIAECSFPLQRFTDKEQLAVFNKARKNIKNVSNYIEWGNKQQNYSYRKGQKYLVTIHEKFSLAIACLIFFLIGAPLGAIIRKGGLGLPMVISILFFVFFYIVKTMGRKFAEEEFISIPLGMWLPIYVLLPIGIFLVIQSTNDSALFDFQSYKNKMKSLFGKK